MSVTGDRTSESKECLACGNTYYKLSKITRAAWRKSKFCSMSCCAAKQRKNSRKSHDGYVYVWVGGVRTLRSHAVIEKARGYPLDPGEVVHHINGNRSDDRIENLRVFASNSDHMRHHALERRDSGFQPGHPPNEQFVSIWPANNTSLERSAEGGAQ